MPRLISLLPSFLLFVVVLKFTLMLTFMDSAIRHRSSDHHKRHAQLRQQHTPLSSLATQFDSRETPVLPRPAPRSSRVLPRRMSRAQYDSLFALCEAMATLLTRHRVPYMMNYGALLGSYLAHDLLPWDDDLDFQVHVAYRGAVIDMFTKVPNEYGIEGVIHEWHPTKMLKIFFKSSLQVGAYLWKWPCIDISWFNTTRGNSIFRALDQNPHQLRLETFLPVHMRPLGRLWLPAPRRPVIMLHHKYHAFSCTSGSFSHANEKHFKARVVPCVDVMDMYPFVRRRPVDGGRRTAETLVLNGTDLYTVVVNEEYQLHKGFTVIP